jgi:hypothetical protein
MPLPTTPNLAQLLDGTPFVGLAVANVHTGFNVSIELEPGCWSPQVFATTASEAIAKCIAKHGQAALHDSDCAVHNAPALPAGPCDCAAAPVIPPPPY